MSEPCDVENSIEPGTINYAFPPPSTGALTAHFDEAIRKITQERGAVYGHPADDFARVDQIKRALADCPDPLARHALEMIAVKMARLVQTPTHLDSWIDIAGYARTAVMCMDRQLEIP